MEGILTPVALALFIYFVVPGFMLIQVYDLVVPTERRSFGSQFVDVVAYSILIFAIWLWPFVLLVVYGDELALWVFSLLLYLLTILIVFVTPPLLAWWFYKKRTEGFLRGQAPHPSPTAWDWFWVERRDNYYVRFYLKEGQDFGGYFGENSFATSFPNMQQVYVEEVWRLDNNGKLAKKVDGTKGAIVNKEDCALIELMEVQEKQPANEEGQE